ncbi:cytochrome c [Chitinophaga lutea]|uniref:Cytochrome c n=1 Tax=Chitinophaga lutea TaxID=2488634 RepID=A0A3N4PSN5_9BACT|nr:cytochrome c [Chitinophaga lutea]RPE08021.1 cytochrome c [Chitinophaga lutea]
MNRIYFQILTIAAVVFCSACGGNTTQKDEQTPAAPAADNSMVADKPAADPKGIGKFRDVQLTHPLDEAMVQKGKTVAELKCTSCHRLTEEKLVGPGWKGVTDRRTPEWIMNFITNVDEMLNKDADAQAMLEVCMVRMPNQNLSDEDARAVLEFLRKNDGKN